MHLFMCAIHSPFSTAVAAYTANDLEAVLINQPFLYSKKEINYEKTKVIFYQNSSVTKKLKIIEAIAHKNKSTLFIKIK